MPYYNPYMNMYNPYSNIKNPEQLQQEINNQMRQYQNAYNQIQQPMPQIQNGGIYHYVDSYSEVENAQVNMNGTPELFVGAGIMWSKKLVNGQPYIEVFSFNKINNVGTPPTETEVVEDKEGMTTEQMFQKMMNEINKLNERIDNINSVKGDVIENESNG